MLAYVVVYQYITNDVYHYFYTLARFLALVTMTKLGYHRVTKARKRTIIIKGENCTV